MKSKQTEITRDISVESLKSNENVKDCDQQTLCAIRFSDKSKVLKLLEE